MKKLPDRLAASASAVRDGRDVRVAVLVDRDLDDCAVLKRDLEEAAKIAGLPSRSAGPRFRVVNRIVVRELEGWYFGDWAAVRKAYARVGGRPTVYERNPDAAHRRTSDSFREQLTRAGVREDAKPLWARRIAPHLSPEQNRSAGFRCFLSGRREMVSW